MLVQQVQQIERAIRARTNSDKKLVNWFLYIFILGPITLGIYAIVIFFQRTNRVDNFIKRKRVYYKNLIDFTDKYAQEKDKYEELRGEIADLQFFYEQNFENSIKELKAGLTFLLTLLTLGIWGFVWLYKINGIWHKLQTFEQEFDDRLSQLWIKLELTKYPINFEIKSSKDRNFWLYLILSFITLGIWFLVWDYKIHTDPDDLFPEFHVAEDTVLQIIRNVK